MKRRKTQQEWARGWSRRLSKENLRRRSPRWAELRLLRPRRQTGAGRRDRGAHGAAGLTRQSRAFGDSTGDGGTGHGPHCSRREPCVPGEHSSPCEPGPTPGSCTYTDVLGCTWMYMHVHGCTQMYSDVHARTRMLTKRHGFLRLGAHLSRTVDKRWRRAHGRVRGSCETDGLLLSSAHGRGASVDAEGTGCTALGAAVWSVRELKAGTPPWLGAQRLERRPRSEGHGSRVAGLIPRPGVGGGAGGGEAISQCDSHIDVSLPAPLHLPLSITLSKNQWRKDPQVRIE